MKFRQAIGAIILDKNDNIIVFQRRDYPENWQGPEGGIDEKETVTEALYRELKEEIDLNSDEFDVLIETKEFIRYFFEGGRQKFGFDGQEKKFFLVKLKTDKIFKFDNTKEIEFSSSKIMKAEDLLKKVPDFKKNMYEKVLKEFKLL